MSTYLEKSLDYYINIMGFTDFVIYPFGTNGRIVKQILDSYGIKEQFIVDQRIHDESKGIYDIDYLKKQSLVDDFVVLLTIHPNSNYYLEVHQQISFIPTNRIIDVFSESVYYNPWRFFEGVHYTDIRFSCIETIAREIYERKIDGAVAEAGVYKGGTASIINRLFPDRKLYLFDTFDGFDKTDLILEEKKGFYRTDLDFSDTNEDIVMKKMIYPQNCIIKKGKFPNTTANLNEKYCFVRLDMDLYTPIYDGLNYFFNQMISGGYICVHDCRSKNFEGARAALLQFCKEKGLNYINMPDTRGTAIIAIGDNNI